MLSRIDGHFGPGTFRYLARTRDRRGTHFKFAISTIQDFSWGAEEKGQAKSKLFESADGSVAAIVRVAYRRFSGIKWVSSDTAQPESIVGAVLRRLSRIPLGPLN